VGSGGNYCFCGFGNAGDADVSRVSEEGDSVDVDAEFCHGMLIFKVAATILIAFGTKAVAHYGTIRALLEYNLASASGTVSAKKASAICCFAAKSSKSSMQKSGATRSNSSPHRRHFIEE